jgi:hypothetical protein
LIVEITEEFGEIGKREIEQILCEDVYNTPIFKAYNNHPSYLKGKFIVQDSGEWKVKGENKSYFVRRDRVEFNRALDNCKV